MTDDKTSDGSRYYNLLFPSLLMLLVLLIFLQTLNFGLTGYDEKWQVLENPLIRGLGFDYIYRMFTRLWITSYYPVRLLSFALDYAVWGLDPTGYHLTNLLLHLLNVLLAFMLILKLQDNLEPKAFFVEFAEDENGFFKKCGALFRKKMDRFLALPPRKITISAIAAGLFAVHPVVVEPVAWIGGREELLAVFFSLIAFHFYLAYAFLREKTQTDDEGAEKQKLKNRYLGIAVASFAAACLSNITAAVLPFILVCYEFLRVKNISKTLKSASAILYFLVITLIAVGVKLSLAGDAPSMLRRGDAAALTLTERLLTALNSLWFNVRSLIWPFDLTVRYPNFVPESIFTPGVIAGVFIIGIFVFLLLEAFKRRLLSFGILWFLIALSPGLLVFNKYVFRADRFLYFPLIGLALAVSYLIREALTNKKKTGLTTALTIVILGFFTVRSISQVQIWQNGLTLFHHAVKANKNFYTGYILLGEELAAQGKAAEAAGMFETAMRLNPQLPDSYNNLGLLLQLSGKKEEAFKLYRQALEIDPASPKAHFNMGNYFRDQMKLEEAAAHYRKALEKNPEDIRILNNLGLTLADMGNLNEAEYYFKKALATGMDDALTFYNLGNVVKAQGRLQEALNYFMRALEKNPQNVKVLNNLGITLAGMRQYDQAMKHFSRAVDIYPEYPDTYYNMGVALMEMGRFQNAEAQYRKALQIAPDYAAALFNLGVLHFRTGNPQAALKDLERLEKIDPNLAKRLYDMMNGDAGP